jgi:hypothetical protein
VLGNVNRRADVHVCGSHSRVYLIVRGGGVVAICATRDAGSELRRRLKDLYVSKDLEPWAPDYVQNEGRRTRLEF